MIRYVVRKVKGSKNRNNEETIDNQDGSTQQPQPSEVPAISNEAPKDTRSKKELWIPRLKLAGAILFPCLLETLDYTVVATSQTNIASNFNRLDLQSYIGTAYVLGSTVFLPIFASLADIFGRYAAMQVSVFIFIIGSAISTGAMNMTTLLVGRGIAGIGAAGLITIVRVILSDSASLEDNNIQGAIMMIVYSVGYSIGPVLGGVLLRTNWRWVFAINLPICAASMILMYLLLPSISKGPQPPQRLKRLPPDVAADLQSRNDHQTEFMASLNRLDIVGATIFVVMGVLVLLGLNWGSTQSWNQPKVIACLAVGGFLIIPFIIWEYIVDHSTDHLAHSATSSPYIEDVEAPSKEKLPKGTAPPQGTRARAARLTPSWAYLMDPMIPMNMFRSYDIIATDFACLTSGMLMLGIFYFVAIFYVIVSGKDAVGAGVQLLYFLPGLGTGAIISMRLLKRVRQPRWPIILATTLCAIGTGFLAEALYKENSGQIAGFMIMTGAGVGMGFGPLAYQARFRQPEDRVAIVIATNLFARTLGGTIGLAQLSAVMYSRVRSYITNQVVTGKISFEDALRIIASLSSVGSKNSGIFALPDNLLTITTDAFRDGLRWAFFSLLPWLAISWVLVLFLRPIDTARLAGKPSEPIGKKEVSHDEEHEQETAV